MHPDRGSADAASTRSATELEARNRMPDPTASDAAPRPKLPPRRTTPRRTTAASSGSRWPVVIGVIVAIIIIRVFLRMLAHG